MVKKNIPHNFTWYQSNVTTSLVLCLIYALCMSQGQNGLDLLKLTSKHWRLKAWCWIPWFFWATARIAKSWGLEPSHDTYIVQPIKYTMTKACFFRHKKCHCVGVQFMTLRGETTVRLGQHTSYNRFWGFKLTITCPIQSNAGFSST